MSTPTASATASPSRFFLQPENSGKWYTAGCKNVLRSAGVVLQGIIDELRKRVLLLIRLQENNLGAALACSKPDGPRYLNMLNLTVEGTYTTMLERLGRAFIDLDSCRDSSDLVRAALTTDDDA
ncbi:hypothetical protein SARC_09195 [Sphaeroforma arctica JP610]|uniref:Uncharacterized protein n=1 Tax=Sphaeroforma arctica JP610 TaxID=667725 RepID=A0A0L0FQT6_9EUKA|nr:hypothetical protein SARC_09195 [Sphaeroforma arctica JP610]KNC78373.1 hypothetical protein SARC_09195 [Sphaeroforma arctica JP610]|eukprot:XP_014152275.1 hypothetical protein SARC_09195 [Sphaeroforma arctica JP610]